MKPLTIGIAVGKNVDYTNWVRQEGHEVIELNYRKNNLGEISKCDGLILSGGADVHPRFYNKPEYVLEYKLDDFDERRDEFELSLLEHATRDHLPLLGICRGLQITNVFLKGTLLPDIPSFGKPDHTKFGEGKDRYHMVKVVGGTLLESTTHTDFGEVNSSHHQSIDQLGEGLMINANSEDGVVEGAEWEQPEGKPFLLLVQWHPERMKNLQSPFSQNIRKRFLQSIKSKV